MYQLISVFLAAMYAALIDVDAPLEDCELILFTNDPTLSPTLVTADLTQPTFTGYAAAAITWVISYTDAGIPFLTSGPVAFHPTAATNLPQAIVGAAIIDSAGLLVAVGKFATPVTLAVSGQYMHASVTFALQDQQEFAFEGYAL